MAQGATVHAFEIALSDVDRGVYETLDFKVARHPSETIDYLVTRVLAYCLEFREGISFSKGLGEGDEPAIWVHDLTGQLVGWIEVGTPEAARLHKAAKAAKHVAVYTHKGVDLLFSKLEGERVFRSDEIGVFSFERRFLEEIGKRFDRRTKMEISVNEKHLYVTINEKTIEGVVTEHRLGDQNN